MSYLWQTTLHHNEHIHPEPVDTKPETSVTIDPLGCDGEQYFYSIMLTVADAAGLTATYEVKLYPNCGSIPNESVIQEYWSNVPGTSVSAIPLNTAPSSTRQLTLFEGATNFAENYGSRIRAYVHPPVS